MQITL